ncbi:MAG: hypothetical protein V4634_18955 [Pseudomonadota bacterium]
MVKKPRFLIAYWIVFAGLMAIAVLSVYLKIVALTNLVLLVLPIGSAIIGASISNALSMQREYDAERAEQLRALEWTCFVIFRQRNALRSLAHHMGAYRMDGMRWSSLPAITSPDYSDVRYDMPSLAFLLKTAEIQVVLDLTIEQERFEAALNTVAIRSKFLVDELQPMTSKSGVSNSKLSEAQALQVYGERIYRTAVQYTDAMFEHIDTAIQSNFSLHQRLHKMAKHLFPKNVFASISQEEKDSLAMTTALEMEVAEKSKIHARP